MMRCDKCDGLIIRVDDEHARCVNCSKIVYVPYKEETDPMGHCREPGCTTQTKGYFCATHVKTAGGTAVGSMGPEGESKRGRPRKTVIVTPEPDASPISDTDHRHTALSGNNAMTREPRSTWPSLIKFTIDRTATDWLKFCIVWQNEYPTYELESVVTLITDNAKVAVWLRPITTA